MGKSSGRAILVFAAMSPPQPWPCYFKCDELVSFTLDTGGSGGHRLTPTLHHIDGNHDNNDPSNWAWGHTGCHSSHHGKGRKNPPMSAETREKISAAQRGRKQSAMQRQKAREHQARLRVRRIAFLSRPEVVQLSQTRRQLRLTIEEVERRTGVTGATLSRLENGLHCPTLKTLKKLRQVFPSLPETW